MREYTGCEAGGAARRSPGRLAGLHSVSIDPSYRIALELLIADAEIVPIDIGDHDAAY